MTTTEEIAEGLAILAKYWPDAEVAANDDCIYAGGPPDKIDAADVTRLTELRWYFYERYDCWSLNV